MENKFAGTGVAIITPFNNDNSVDYVSFKKLIEHLIRGNINYIVFFGTTGESNSLSIPEKNKILEFAVKLINKRVKIVVGIGGNNTNSVVKEIKSYNFDSIDAILSVSPAYNKPSQQGIYAHYKKISENSPVDIIIYNVPSRTGSNISAKTTLKLANKFKNIIAIKEASGDIIQIMEIIKNSPKKFSVISGDDAITLPMIFLGAIGVISVVAMARPIEFSNMVNYALNKNYEDAKKIHYSLIELCHHIFAEGNPAGIKSSLKLLGICESNLRLPLVNISKERIKILKKILL